MEWFIRYGFPYPKTLGSFSSLEEAAKKVDCLGILKSNVELITSSFGVGGCHRAIWNGKEWVNPRTGTAWWG